MAFKLSENRLEEKRLLFINSVQFQVLRSMSRDSDGFPFKLFVASRHAEKKRGSTPFGRFAIGRLNIGCLIMLVKIKCRGPHSTMDSALALHPVAPGSILDIAEIY